MIVVVLVTLALGFITGYGILGPLANGKRPFSPPDGMPGTFAPWRPWKKIKR